MKKLFFILVLGVLAFAGCQTTTPRKNQVQNIEHKKMEIDELFSSLNNQQNNFADAQPQKDENQEFCILE